jgi:RNA polymerase sigma-70 factor (ECF subfamily)
MDQTGRSNEEWVRLLRLPSPQCNEAIEDLRNLLLRGLTATFAGRSRADRSALEDLTQESLIRILDSLDGFRGESRFSTWAMKIAVRLTLTELRRRRWSDVSLESLHEQGFQPPAMGKGGDPEKQAVRRAVLDALMNAVKNDLTDRQRRAMMAIRFGGMPLEEAARMLGTNRNSLYKLMHDARKRIKRALLAGDLREQDIAEAFT